MEALIPAAKAQTFFSHIEARELYFMSGIELCSPQERYTFFSLTLIALNDLKNCFFFHNQKYRQIFKWNIKLTFYERYSANIDSHKYNFHLKFKFRKKRNVYNLLKKMVGLI